MLEDLMSAENLAELKQKYNGQVVEIEPGIVKLGGESDFPAILVFSRKVNKDRVTVDLLFGETEGRNNLPAIPRES